MDPVLTLKNLVLGTVPVSTSIEMLESVGRVIAEANSLKLSEAEFQAAIQLIQEHQMWRMDLGTELVAKEHVPWLDERRDSISWTRWNLFSMSLRSASSMNESVLEVMDRRSSKILDLTGDPLADGSWSRKGLVIGDVQSGKTVNYLALFNKAADAGYKIFILLAGDKESLRRQTQERIDEGFIGRDTKLLANVGEEVMFSSSPIGLATLDPKFQHPSSLTTFWQDFRVGSTNQLQNLNNNSIPYVFVVKKNKSVLSNLAKFFSASAGPSGKIEAPMLLLDDEADYASINTSSTETSPTAINQGIRELIASFERSSYVGFTATPFANVLISDADESDLFPRDFIYSLESPTNYFGPQQMFDETSEQCGTLVPLYDAEKYFPARHRKTLRVESIPSSMRVAILCFYISNAIRDLRPSQSKSARSMMIHVSRFKDVHQQLFELVSEICADVNSTLRFGIGSEELLAEMKQIFEIHFGHVSETWSQIAAILPKSSHGTEVFAVNSDKSNKDWRSAYDSESPRVIAIGGDVLSRGLTLDGLAISYYFRRSLAYDTVMQMGRWFGYRDGYRDCCKIFIDLEVAVWFREISDSLDELKQQLHRMHVNKQTPENFGLAVRCHPGSVLTVTALNKLRSGQKVAMNVSLWGTSIQTTRLRRDRTSLEKNLLAAEVLIRELRSRNLEQLTTKKESWKKAPRSLITDFFSQFRASESDRNFGNNGFLRFISNALEERLEEWDVLVQTGRGSATQFADRQISPVERSFGKTPSDPGVMLVNRQKASLSGSEDLKLAISREKLAELGESPTRAELAAALDRPLLMLYPTKPMFNQKDDVGPIDFEGLVLGVTVSFPDVGLETASDPALVDYLVNSVWQKQNSTLFDLDVDEEDELD